MKAEFIRELKSMNWVAFFFSAYFVTYGLVNISNILWIQIIMGGLGLYVEYEAQRIWGLSYAYKRAGKRGWWLKAVYLGYIIIFALMSGVGFFATEINIQETTAAKVEAIEHNNQRRVDQLYKEIDRVSSQIQREGQTGVGGKYQGLQTELNGYNNELKDLMQQGKTGIKVEVKAQTKDMFANLSNALWGIPKNILILVMFASALVIVYIGLMLKPMQVALEYQLNNVTNNVTTYNEPDFDLKNYETGKTFQNVSKTCPSCGEAFIPTRIDQIYCNGACRVRAFRARHLIDDGFPPEIKPKQ